MKNAGHRTTGFTLIELLCVIAIIVLLMAILMPALSRARASALSLKCLSNVRALGQYTLLYAAEYNNALPWADQKYLAPGDTANSITLDDNMLEWTNIVLAYAHNLTLDYTKVPPNPQLQLGKDPLLGCPSVTHERTGAGGIQIGMNRWFDSGMHGNTPAERLANQQNAVCIKIGQVMRQSDIVLYGDKTLLQYSPLIHEKVQIPPQPSTTIGSNPAYYPDLRHGGSGNPAANFVFVDGHGEALKGNEASRYTHYDFRQ